MSEILPTLMLNCTKQTLFAIDFFDFFKKKQQQQHAKDF